MGDSIMPETAGQSDVFATDNGTLYLKEPHVIAIAKPTIDLSNFHTFLEGFPPVAGFSSFDAGNFLFTPEADEIGKIDQAAALCKVAGQLCYMSYGPKSTKLIGPYIEHILNRGHGSVLEHANFTLLFYGISRSVTHELIRHRAGFSYSQVSQRYVGEGVLRFVLRPEFDDDGELFSAFVKRIDSIAYEYRVLLDTLSHLPRKEAHQAARAVLNNEVEAPIIVTANARAWRHFLEMRGSLEADIEIRRLAIAVLRAVGNISPFLFQGMWEDGEGLNTVIVSNHRKV